MTSPRAADERSMGLAIDVSSTFGIIGSGWRARATETRWWPSRIA